MDTANLIRMANRIGDFFAAMPERDEALDGIAQHIGKFWEPRMRRQLLSEIDAGRVDDLQDIVRSAVVHHRAMLQG